MRKIYRGFINGETKTLEELGLLNAEIKHVYTIIDETKYLFNPKTGQRITIDSDDAHLSHLDNVFLEDYYHDWRVNDGVFSFYGHSGTKGQLHDLLFILK